VKSARIDITGVLQRAREAFFVLDDRGKLVFGNPAFFGLLQASATDRPVSELVAPPLDVAPGQVRRATRPWGEGKQRRWFDVIFIPLEESAGVPLATLGCVVPGDRPSTVVAAADSELAERQERIREQQQAQFGFEALPAKSDPMLRLLHQVRLAVGSGDPTTLVGETGVGKQTLARVIYHHRQEPRGPLVVLDCRMLPPDVQRRQLLGGQTPPTAGDFPAGVLNASGPGTLLVVGPLSLAHDLQNELARVFAGRNRGWNLLATEREPLEAGCDDGRLVEPLFHLLSTLVIPVPALRARRAELPDHCAWVLKRLMERGSKSLVIEPSAMDLLSAYHWPGNLRELYVVLEQASQRSGSRSISAADLPRRFRRPAPATALEAAPPPPPLPGLDNVLEEVERRLLRLALDRARGNKSQAADTLAISRPRLLRRLEQLGMTEGRGQ
jgi:DNA-binding NtrC family response regulator